MLYGCSQDRQADNESLLQRIDRIDVGIDDDELTLVLEQSVLVVVIIARWLMPKGNLSRGRLSGKCRPCCLWAHAGACWMVRTLRHYVREKSATA